MNEQDINDRADCPKFTELSAWMDGEGATAVGEHVGTCQACDRTVKFFRKVDQAIVCAMAPSPELAARITAACERDRGVQALRFWLIGLGRMAAAAALVITAGIAAWFYSTKPVPPHAQISNYGKNVIAPEPVARTTAIGSTVPADAIPHVDDYVWDDESEEWVPRGSVRAADLTMASAGNTGASETDRGVREIADAVRHVWVVGDVKKTDRIIRKSLPPELAAQLETLTANRPITLRMTFKDRDLQGFVDKLSAAGFSLVSPELPQPGEARRILAVGKPVEYEAELVPPAAPR